EIEETEGAGEPEHANELAVAVEEREALRVPLPHHVLVVPDLHVQRSLELAGAEAGSAEIAEGLESGVEEDDAVASVVDHDHRVALDAQVRRVHEREVARIEIRRAGGEHLSD